MTTYQVMTETHLVSLLKLWLQGDSVKYNGYNTDLASVSGLIDGSLEKFETFLVLLNVWCKATFVTNVGCILTVLLFNHRLKYHT